MPGPLSGVRVLELPAIGPAPFCGALLADMGADVVRIDRAASIDLGTPVPPHFDFYNRNKRSVALDLKARPAVDAALQLARHADILIEGFRPGVAERLGLGPVECLQVNPRLVYGRMTGWGQDGPLAQAVGHDINYLALSGALHCIGEKGRPPVPPLNLAADLGAGAMYLAVGVLAALAEARASGRGQVVDAAMVDGLANLMSAFSAFRQMGEWTADRGENIVDGGAHFYGTYETSDGKYIAVGAIEARFYRALTDAMGLDAEALPPQNDRSTWASMREIFEAIFRTRTRDEWVDVMAGRDACFSPVLTLDEAPAHPHMQARAVFSRFDGVLHPSPAPRFDRTPGGLRRGAPAAGEQSAEVLEEWGVEASAIDALRASGAMVQAVNAERAAR
ncbi:CaiB/BaiF CoA-transferase family protein [Variovorax sp. dw_954]|uniref:CaiB/BaiF CoA transferase family protein n=1 Tax=Variovorax sp. dw_954 TaxID=2720078 RepID=UPI001C4A19A5|nr:CaiB/BaiF CoA-transferase family protein [Variovorax sp. dw_954]